MSRFEADYVGIGRMLRMDTVRLEMLRRAELVMAEAIRTAPTGTEGDDPGEYARSFRTESGADGVRAYGRVVNDSNEALAVEYGFKATPRYRVLGRALSAAGDGTPSPYGE